MTLDAGVERVSVDFAETLWTCCEGFAETSSTRYEGGGKGRSEGCGNGKGFAEALAEP